MSVPQLERDGEVSYFVDATGERFRVYDVLFTRGRKRIMPLESSQANHRYFVAPDGVTKAYRFEKAEPRALEPARLVAQFGAAGFTAQSSRDIKALRPT